LKRHELPSRAKRKVELNDLLVSSLKGSKEKIALVDVEGYNLLASTGFFVVTSDYLKPEVIYAILRSKFYELFIEQMATGAIMSAITDKYFKQIELPIIGEEIQCEIQKDIMSYIEKRNSAFDNLDEIKKRFDEVLSI
jgi:type I restriction enzyme S subunit